MTKIDITDRYFEEEEVRSNPNPYEDYFYALKNTFDLDGVESFLDVGCATGWLLFFLRKNFPEIQIRGLEYFEYHKIAADPSINKEIQIPVQGGASLRARRRGRRGHRGGWAGRRRVRSGRPRDWGKWSDRRIPRKSRRFRDCDAQALK